MANRFSCEWVIRPSAVCTVCAVVKSFRDTNWRPNKINILHLRVLLVKFNDALNYVNETRICLRQFVNTYVHENVCVRGFDRSEFCRKEKYVLTISVRSKYRFQKCAHNVGTNVQVGINVQDNDYRFLCKSLH